MGYVLSVDVNKPYNERATGISGSYTTTRQGIADVYNQSKQGYADLYNQQKTSTAAAQDTLLAGRTQAQNLSYQAAQEPLKYNLSQAGSLYQPARNEMYTQNAAAQAALREKMANIGASGGGGMSQKQQQKLGTSFQQGLTGVDLAQQGYIDEQNRGLTSLASQNEASLANLNAESGFAKSQAIADLEARMTQAGIDSDSELGQQLASLSQQESSALSQNEMARMQAEQSQRTNDINMYLNMFLNGRISKKQFRDMTGMEI